MTSTTPDANQILMGGGGAPTAKFPTIGTRISGKIVAPPRAYQEREYDRNNPGGGAPKFYPKSGDPIMAVSVDLQTDQRDPADSEDTGIRRLYIEGKRLKDAIRDSVRAAGGNGLEVGGHLTVTFTGEEDTGAGQPAKCYQAQYTLAASAVLMTDPTPAPTPAPIAAVPNPAPQATPAATAPMQFTPEQLQALANYQAQQQAAQAG